MKIKLIWLGFVLLSMFIIIRSLILTIEYYQNRIAYIETLVRPPSSFPLNLKWQVGLGRYTYDFPMYQNGLVFIPTHGAITNSWYGIDAETGQIVWQRRVFESNFRRCLTSEYLVLSGSRSFMVLKTRTGELVWQKERAGTASCSKDVVFYSEVPRNSIQAAALETGQELWNGTKPQESFFGLIFNSETNEIIGAHGEFFYLIDPQTGLLKYSFGKVVPAPQDGRGERGPMYVIDRGELFVGGTVLNTETGQVIHREERYGSSRPPTVTSDTMYLAALTDGVVAFDRATYNVKWIYPSPQPKLGSEPLETISSVAILDGIGYIIFADVSLRAFDLKTGQELGYWQAGEDDLWNWPVCTYPPPPISCIESARVGLTTSENMLFASFGDGKLYAFSK